MYALMSMPAMPKMRPTVPKRWSGRPMYLPMYMTVRRSKKPLSRRPPAVFGYAVLSRVVLDGYFTDAVSFQVGEYGDVAVEFAEYAYVFCDFAAIDFEAAVKVVYVYTRYKARDPVEEFGGQSFAQGVKAFFLPSGDEVIAFFDFG